MKSISISRWLRGIAVAAVCIAAPLAQAIPLSFATHGLGSYEPASQANNNAEVTAAVNAVITWYNGGANPNGGAIVYTLAPGSNTPPPALPGPVTFGFKDENGPFDDVNPANYQYVLGKYGNTAYIFYIGNLAPGSYSLPGTLGGNGLSHEVAFSAPTNNRVPDGGFTMALLGLTLLGLEALRRKRTLG